MIVPFVHDGGISTSSLPELTSSGVIVFPLNNTASAVTLTDCGPVDVRSSPAAPEDVFPTSPLLCQFSERLSDDTAAPGG